MSYVLQDLEQEFGVELDLYDNGDYLTLSKIVVPEEARGSGVGRQVMQKVIDYADSMNKTIYLTPSTDFGASSKSRLEKFYKEFGFKKKPRHDFKTRETMVRYNESNERVTDMKHLNLFESFVNEAKIDDLQKALDKTPAEKFDLIVGIKGMEQVVHSNGLEGVTGDTATEEELEKLFNAVNSKLYYPRLPVSYFFDEPNRVPKGTKLVHLTNHADAIVSGGFTRGTRDFNDLGMSWGSRTATPKPGWNYAFPADYIEYEYKSLEKAMKHWNAKQAVEFEAEAIVAFHYGDNVFQAMFWGPSAKNIKRIK